MPKKLPENPEIQDIDEMARRIDAALAEARRALENLQTKEIETTGASSALTGDSPSQMEELDAVAAGFGEDRDASVHEP
ncbi:MAG: hypothetical protein KKC18_15115 [Chloroflexi bacterium]|nr:hypothetical protein [Chloroflexota bacterium]